MLQQTAERATHQAADPFAKGIPTKVTLPYQTTLSAPGADFLSKKQYTYKGKLGRPLEPISSLCGRTGGDVELCA
jgi:hypothetical protein